jgi:arsenate reductase
MRNTLMMRARAWAAAWLGIILVTLPPAAGARAQTPAPAGTRPTVLFMCPHGAGKSVLASAYFQRLAKERGLNVRVESAGTDPDPEVAPIVATHLKKTGYELPVAKPRRVTDADLATADVVVSIGCDLKSFAPPRGTLLRWDDVPGPSEDLAGAEATIRAQATQLVDELLSQAKSRK